MAEKVLKLEQLEYYNGKIKDKYVAKELRSGSHDQFKVLSDNNLTDELLAKIQNAGVNSFNGDYNSLTSKPAIDGQELDSTSTAEALGLAKADQLPKTATTEIEGLVKPDGKTIQIEAGVISAPSIDLEPYAKKEEIPVIATAAKAGIVKPDDKTIKITAEGVISSPDQDLSSLATKEELPKAATQEAAGLVKPGTGLSVTEDGTLNAAEVDLSDYVKTEAISDMLTQTQAAADYIKKTEAATKTELADYAKSTQVATDIQSVKTEIQESIDSKLGSVYKIKGSVAFGLLPLPAQENLGDVYNIEGAFTSDAKFFEEDKQYPAGTNVVVAEKDGAYKYDTLAGAIDLTTYATTASLEAYAKTESLDLYAKKTDLDAYIKTEDITSISNEQIDSLFGDV